MFSWYNVLTMFCSCNVQPKPPLLLMKYCKGTICHPEWVLNNRQPDTHNSNNVDYNKYYWHYGYLTAINCVNYCTSCVCVNYNTLSNSKLLQLPHKLCLFVSPLITTHFPTPNFFTFNKHMLCVILTPPVDTCTRLPRGIVTPIRKHIARKRTLEISSAIITCELDFQRRWRSSENNCRAAVRHLPHCSGEQLKAHTHPPLNCRL